MKNPSLKEGFLKIGLTKSIEKRVKSASGTSLPDNFEILSYYEVKDMLKAEKLVFDLLDNYRYKKDKEFFVCPYVVADNACIISQRKINSLVNKKYGRVHYSDDSFYDVLENGIDNDVDNYIFEV